MGLFDGVTGAKAGVGGVYFLAGLYKVQVLACKAIRSRKGVDLFIVECRVLESNNPDRQPGMQCSWVVAMDKDAALGNIKAFAAAVNDLNADDPSIDDPQSENYIDGDTIEYMVADENPLGEADLVLNLECTAIKTRAGGDFTLHHWSPAG